MCCPSRRGLGVPLGAMEVPEPVCVHGRVGLRRPRSCELLLTF